MTDVLSLNSYRLVGRSGLRVSPFALGTMTFGTDWGWGTDKDEARLIFEAYVERGGNFIDTANQYTSGTSEQLVGQFASDKRDRLVIATKYTLAARPGDPNSGGNHRKSMMSSVETSLRRLRTDYIDVLYLNAWDGTTPAEEILRALDDLVRSGKVLYLGISDTPAWQTSRMQVIAELRGWSPLIALQIEYSLIERTGERELIPMAQEMGLAVVPWSPLGGGILTGKYTRSDLDRAMCQTYGTGSRKSLVIASGALSERRLAIAGVVESIATEIAKSPSQVALAWTLLNPAVTAPIIGARTLEQLHDNFGAFDVLLTEEHRARLEQASAVEFGFPHDLLRSWVENGILFRGRGTNKLY